MGHRRPEISARRAVARRARAVAAAATIPLLAACGGSGEESGSVPVPGDCLQSWNSEQAAISFGRHVYDTHDTRQAQVALLEPAGESLNIRGETCAVIFAVPENDFEYGDVGLVVTDFGWASMQELARGDQIELERLQQEATESPNATLFPDGSIEPG